MAAEKQLLHVQGLTRCLDIEQGFGRSNLTDRGQNLIEGFMDELSTDAVGLKILPGNSYVLFRYLQVKALHSY